MTGEPWLSRRDALRAGAAAAGLFTVASCSTPAAPSGDRPTRTQGPSPTPSLDGPTGPGRLVRWDPAPADALVDAFGVVTHLHFAGSPYADHDAVLRWLGLLGARHVRNRLAPQADVLDAFARMATQGIDVQAVCGALGDEQSMDLLMDTVVRRYPDPGAVFSAFEGINEPNNDGVPWVAETRQKTIELRRARDARGLGGIPLVAPSLARVTAGGVEGADTLAQAASLGDLSAYVDFGNMHVYPRGLPPSEDIDYFARCAALVSGSRPVMCTEGGYFTAVDYQGGAFPVPPAVSAAYTPQMLLEHWNAGTARFFRYELFDDPGLGDVDREAAFGMVGSLDLAGAALNVPKPDFVTVRRLLAACADPGPAFTPPPVQMSLRGPDDLRSALFARRDGTLVVCVWLDRPIYDPDSRRLLVDPTELVWTAELGLPEKRAVTVQPLMSTAPPVRHARVRRLSVDLPSGVSLLTVAPR